MTDHPDLFGKPPPQPSVPFNNGSETSRDAAESIKPDLARLEAMVIGFIRLRGQEGATCDEAEEHLGLSHQTCSARFNGLAGRGLIEKAGAQRKTRSGRRAEVYVVARRQAEDAAA
jgi:hypothetical protein